MSSFFFFKQKTAYEMRISDWSSDVCSSDLRPTRPGTQDPFMTRRIARGSLDRRTIVAERIRVAGRNIIIVRAIVPTEGMVTICHHGTVAALATRARSEEHTSELQSLMRISYAVFCLKKKTTTTQKKHSTKIQTD